MKNKLFVLICANFANAFCQAQEVPAFAKKVYSDICETMGNGKLLMPSLVLNLDPKAVATFYPDGMNKNGNGKAEVAIGVKFVELVRGFGVDSSNAMAHVLGHELAHIILGQNKE